MQCDYCNAEFTYSTELSAHQEVHHKYFSCLVCDKGFGPGGYQPRTDRDAHLKAHGKNVRRNALKKEGDSIKKTLLDKKKLNY